jgi:hypothetical protein
VISITHSAGKRNTERHLDAGHVANEPAKGIATRTQPHTASADRSRTLAWHIVRRPRGLIAGAIQYGHLHAQITLGYAKAREFHQMEEFLQVAC